MLKYQVTLEYFHSLYFSIECTEGKKTIAVVYTLRVTNTWKHLLSSSFVFYLEVTQKGGRNKVKGQTIVSDSFFLQKLYSLIFVYCPEAFRPRPSSELFFLFDRC